jgi:hypothetical protein
MEDNRFWDSRFWDRVKKLSALASIIAAFAAIVGLAYTIWRDRSVGQPQPTSGQPGGFILSLWTPTYVIGGSLVLAAVIHLLAAFMSRRSLKKQITHLEEERTNNSWLQTIAIREANAIQRVVRVLDCTLKYKDRESKAPYVNFNFHLVNMSVYSVRAENAIGGWVDFAGRRLGGHIKRTDQDGDFEHGQDSYVVITQWLSKEDIEMIDSSNQQCAFTFKNLEVWISGSDKFEHDRQVVRGRLEIPCHIERLGQGVLNDSESKWLEDIANEDRNSIDHLVTITVIDPQPNRLSEGVAYIEFIFYIFNSSVFDISIDDAIDGYISFREGNHEDRLHEYKELKDNQAKAVPSRGQGHFTIYQRLTETEAKHFVKTDDVWFSFNNLVITIKGANESDGVVEKRLDTSSRPTSKTIRWFYHEPDAAIAYRRLSFSQPKHDGDQETTRLKDEIESLRAELVKLNSVAIEVDTNSQSDVRLRAHENIKDLFDSAHPAIKVDMYILVANLKVQFENHDVHRRKLKHIELSLIHVRDAQEETIPFLEEPVMLLVEPDKNGEKRRFPEIDFPEQSITLLWLHFNAHVPREPAEKLNENYFLRLTLHALGQQPISQDLDANWVEALSNATYLRQRANAFSDHRLI